MIAQRRESGAFVVNEERGYQWRWTETRGRGSSSVGVMLVGERKKRRKEEKSEAIEGHIYARKGWLFKTTEKRRRQSFFFLMRLKGSEDVKKC